MTEQNVFYLTRRVGNTTFRVKVSCPSIGTETMEEKILRMIQNEAGYTPSECGIMDPPQVSRPA